MHKNSRNLQCKFGCFYCIQLLRNIDENTKNMLPKGIICDIIINVDSLRWAVRVKLFAY